MHNHLIHRSYNTRMDSIRDRLLTSSRKVVSVIHRVRDVDGMSTRDRPTSIFRRGNKKDLDCEPSPKTQWHSLLTSEKHATTGLEA